MLNRKYNVQLTSIVSEKHLSEDFILSTTLNDDSEYFTNGGEPARNGAFVAVEDLFDAAVTRPDNKKLIHRSALMGKIYKLPSSSKLCQNEFF